MFHDSGKIWLGCWYGNARRSICNGISLKEIEIILIVRQNSRLKLPLTASRILETVEISRQGQVSLLPNPPLNARRVICTCGNIFMSLNKIVVERNEFSFVDINIYEIRSDTSSHWYICIYIYMKISSYRIVVPLW